MMRFTRQEEPAAWDARCRKRGRKWLRDHPGSDRPCDYWTEFEKELREAFCGLCAFCAMMVMKADMDHFVPVAQLKKKRRDRAYEWSNFRYVEGVLNQRKHDKTVLDPFKVRDDWFEVILPSLQLRLTDAVPKQTRKLAQFTLDELGLGHDEVVLRYRREWFVQYQKRTLTLEGLERFAPLIARAVRADFARNKDWRDPTGTKD